MMRPWLTTLSLALALLTAVPALSLAAGRPVTVASLLGEDKPETKIWVRIRERIEATLPGRFDIRIAANAALGGEKDVNEATRIGTVQGALSTLAALSAWVPEGQVLDLPFVFRDRGHIDRVVAGPIGTWLAEKYAAQGFQVLGFVTYGARHLLSKSPLSGPQALQGLKIRVIQSPLHAELWRAFGANPTPLPLPETYNALKTGVVDLMDLTLPAYVGFKLADVVPVVTETGHIWSVGAVYVGRRFWSSLKPEEQAAFAAAGREGASSFNALMIEDEIKARAEAVAGGATLTAVADTAPWRAGAAPVREAFAAKIGVTAQAKAILETP